MILMDPNEPGQVYELLRSRGIDIELRELDFYDYVVEGRCGAVGVERKTLDDFIASVLDGRIFYQTYKLSHDFDTSFLTIIGDLNLYVVERATVVGDTGETVGRIYLGALIGIGLRRALDGRGGRVHPIILPDMECFVDFLELLNKKLDQSDLFRLPVGGRHTEVGNYMVAMLMCIPGVGREKAKALYKRFKNMSNLVQADVKQIASVKGIGKKLAERIYHSLRGE